MPSAIMTTYKGPTNFKPGRIKVTCFVVDNQKQVIYVNWDHSKSQYDNHRDAAKQLVHNGWCVMSNDFGPDSMVHCLYPEL